MTSPLAAAEPLDLVYIFRHSKHGDQEIRYSLRSVAKNLPFIRKVWIFGDRPEFLTDDKLTDDKALVEHVPHEYLAPLLGYRTPVRNDFLLLTLASLLPELSFHFLRFADDYIVLQPVSREQICTPRALEDLNHVKRPANLPSCSSSDFGPGTLDIGLPPVRHAPWRAQLWRTFDTLQQYGYAGYNFEAHVPQPYTKKQVYEAYMAFRPFLSEERYGGLVAPTAVYNYALKHFGLPFVCLADEQSRAGFYGSCPSEAEIVTTCQEKLFLNFDDTAFGPPLAQFLSSLFPDPCQYERR